MPRRTSIDADNDRTVTRDDLQVTYEWTDGNGETRKIKTMGQGPAKLATDEDKAMDEFGFTNPDLHRRIKEPSEDPIPESDDKRNQELTKRSYQLSIMNVNSYRTITTTVHNEDSVDDETP